MLKSIRRLISGLDKNKQSKILSEEEISAFVPYELFPCLQVQELFYTEDTPQSLQTKPLNKPYDIELPLGPEHTWVNESDTPCYLLCMMTGTDKNNERKKMVGE